MGAYLQSPAQVPMWVAGVSICLLAAAGIVAIARSIPTSYVHSPRDSASSLESASSVPEGTHVRKRPSVPAVRITVNQRRNGVRCPECGVVESIRKRDLSGDSGGQGTFGVEVADADSAAASDAASAADGATAKNYATTVRFRDGSTVVLNEATPRSWRVGSRVRVIGRSFAATDGARVAEEPASGSRIGGDPSGADGPRTNAKPPSG